MDAISWKKPADRDVWLCRTFEHAVVGVAVCDSHGKVVGANKAFYALLGRRRGELGTQSLVDLTHPADKTAVAAGMGDLVSGRVQDFIKECRFLHLDGTDVWTRISVSLCPVDEGSPARLAVLAEDVTARRRAEQAVRESETLALVGRLAASIAHEINNPLESIVNLHYLALGTENREQSRHYIEMAEEETARVSKIALQTLRFHRQAPKPVACHPFELLETVLEMFRVKLAQSHITVRLEKTDSPKFDCFDGELRQVLANMVGNALDAMRGIAGELRIRLRPGTDWRSGLPGVRITIADRGAGMSRETRRRIYEPFFTTKGAVGSGIGLWLSAEIVAKHSGSLHVRSSTAQGRSGTAFTMVFPTHGPASSAAEDLAQLA
jgi:PAS domain S-box-containing protein